MPSFASQQIMPPKHWQEFEELSADLWEKIFESTDTNLHGRGGQKQCGVDIYGHIGQTTDWFGVQCKGKDSRYNNPATISELESEVKKAKSFVPPLKRFVFATTAPNDVAIQQRAREITQEHQSLGLFSVEVKGWDDIQRKISLYPELMEKYYPEQSPKMNLILAQLTQVKASITSVDSGSGIVNDAISAEIDKYRNLLNKGKYQTAKSLLEDLQERSWSDLSDNNKFRLLTNIASANLSLGDSKQAARQFIEAKIFEPKNEKALCNVAVAYYLLGQDNLAYDAAVVAIEKYPKSSAAHRLKLVCSDDELLDVPEDSIPVELHCVAEVAFAIGHIYLRREQFSEATKWLKSGHEIDSTMLELTISYANALLSEVDKANRSTYGEQLLPVDIEKIHQADELLTTVWDKVENFESISAFEAAICNLLFAKSLIADAEVAIKIASAAVKKLTDSVELIKRYVYLLTEYKDYKSAIDLLKDKYKVYPTELTKIYAEVLAENKQYSDSLKVINSYIENVEDKTEKIYAQGMALKLAYSDKQEVPTQAIKKALKTHPKSVSLRLDVADVFQFSGQQKSALKEINRAKKLLNSDSSYIENTRVAEGLYIHGKYAKALRIYKSIVKNKVDSKPFRHLLYCYYRTNQRKNAFELLETLPAITRQFSFYQRISAALLEQAGKLPEAIQELEIYLASNADDLEEVLHWFRLCQKSGETKKIENYLQNPSSFSDSEPVAAMELASYISQFIGFEKGLKLACDTLKHNLDNPDVCLSYTSLFMARGDSDEVLNVDVVDVNTAISLENQHGDKKVYLITDDVVIEGRSISSVHPVSRAVLNKCKGDAVTIMLSSLDSEEYEIKDIRSEFVYFFQYIMDSFNHKFPEHNGLSKLSLKKKNNGEYDFSKLFEMIDKQHAFSQEVLNDYATNLLPIITVAKRLNKNPIDVWIGMQSDINVKIFNCAETHDERQHAFELLNLERSYVVDPLTLYNLYCFELLDVVIQVVGQLSVTQSCIDLLKATIIERERVRGKRTGTISKCDDGYIADEYSKDEIVKSIEKLESLCDWIKQNCKILPAIEKSEPNETVAILPDILDGTFYDCLIAADGADYCLLSEDLRFRQISKFALDVDGVWVHAVLMKAVEDGLISLELYTKITIEFLRAGLNFTSINSECLVSIATTNKWEVSDDLIVGLKSLSAVGNDTASTLRVVANFLCEAVYSGENIEGIVYEVLNNLTNNYQHKNSDNFIKSLINLSSYFSDGRDKNYYLTLIYKWCEGYFIVNKYFKGKG